MTGRTVEWGVMFHDGSVLHPWNGHTQEQRAREYLAGVVAVNPFDNITLATRRGADEPWRRENAECGFTWEVESAWNKGQVVCKQRGPHEMHEGVFDGDLWRRRATPESADPCGECGGSGLVRQISQEPPDDDEVTCRSCKGSGRENTDECDEGCWGFTLEECGHGPENTDCEALPLTPKNPRTHVGHHRQSAEKCAACAADDCNTCLRVYDNTIPCDCNHNALLTTPGNADLKEQP